MYAGLFEKQRYPITECRCNFNQPSYWSYKSISTVTRKTTPLLRVMDVFKMYFVRFGCAKDVMLKKETISKYMF